MLVLLIILSVLLLLFLLTLFNVYIYGEFRQELSLVIKVAFLKFRILPEKPKKKKPKPKKKSGNKKKKSQEKKPEKKVSPLDYFKQKGLSGIINIIKKVAYFAVDAFKDLFKKITVTNFFLDFKIAGEDAADSAIKYGYCCSAIFPALRLIFGVVKCEHYDVNINPDFSNTPKTSVDVRITAKIRLCSIIAFAASKAVSALRIYLKAKPKSKPKT